MFQTVLDTPVGAVVQRDFQQQELDDDHQDRLQEEGCRVVCAEPVKDSADETSLESCCDSKHGWVVLEYRREEHNQGYVK